MLTDIGNTAQHLYGFFAHIKTSKFYENLKHYLLSFIPASKPPPPTLVKDKTNPIDGDKVTFSCITNVAPGSIAMFIFKKGETTLISTFSSSYEVNPATIGISEGAYICYVTINLVTSDHSNTVDLTREKQDR